MPTYYYNNSSANIFFSKIVEIRNELERQNLLAKMKSYTDELYAWGG